MSNQLSNTIILKTGIGSFTGIAGYKLYQIRQNRRAGSTERLSLQLINTRMMAQGFVMGKSYLLHPKKMKFVLVIKFKVK